MTPGHEDEVNIKKTTHCAHFGSTFTKKTTYCTYSKIHLNYKTTRVATDIHISHIK